MSRIWNNAQRLFNATWRVPLSITKGNDQQGIAYIYRYLSFLIISCFYVIGQPQAPIWVKLLVVFCLLIENLAVTGMYRRHQQTPGIIRALISIETIGVLLLVMETGGFSSPFVWYALNSVFMAATLLSMYESWMNFAIYILTGTVLFDFSARTPHTFLPKQLFSNESGLILVAILVTVLFHLYTRLARELEARQHLLQAQTKELHRMNQQLHTEHTRTEHLLRQVMTLYQTMSEMNYAENPSCLCELFAKTAIELIGCASAVFASEQESVCYHVLSIAQPEDIDQHTLQQKVDDLLATWCRGDVHLLSPKEQQTPFYTLRSRGIKGESRQLIAIFSQTPFSLEEADVRSLDVLLEFASAVIERFTYEHITGKLLVAQEQNRIAREMHDHVSQRLFSIVYALHGLTANQSPLDILKLKNKLLVIQDTANACIQDFRRSINQLSGLSDDGNAWKNDIKTYLDHLRDLQNIDAQFNVNGDLSLIHDHLAKVLYRVILEACGNAVRHGGCSSIDVHLATLPREVHLVITDNGCGFDSYQVTTLLPEKHYGLGLHNIVHSVQNCGGSVSIDSTIGHGTQINVYLPLEFNHETTKLIAKEITSCVLS